MMQNYLVEVFLISYNYVFKIYNLCKKKFCINIKKILKNCKKINI